MWANIAPAFRITLVLTILTGLIYPAAVTVVAQLVFPKQSHGSLISSRGTVVGSELIGQNFSKPQYFHPRPSAAGTTGYDALSSTASNLGPTSQKLIDGVKAAVAQYRKENPDSEGPIPADAVTASGSGLDPHISPANADIQVSRVARARGIDPAAVRQLVSQSAERPWLGFIGESRVNVLRLNLALDQQFGRK
jgi:K+-transporting ATPase ATPase C chain